MSDIRYLLDEYVDPILRTKLLRRDSDLTVEMSGRGEPQNLKRSLIRAPLH